MNTVAVCIQIHSYSFTHVNIQDILVTLTNLSSERKLYIETWTLTKALYTGSFHLPISTYFTLYNSLYKIKKITGFILFLILK